MRAVETKLLLGVEKRTKSLDFALELSTANLPFVTIGLDFLELSFQARHLINALLSIPTSCQSVCLALLDLGRRFIRGTAFGGI